MSAIDLVSVEKTYVRFSKPGWAAASLLGLPTPAKCKTEFAALSDVNLRISSGEKVALIGPNGAGKSTILKLISGQIRPTGGSLRVKGNVQALLQLGAGFHPEYTGLENAYSLLSLAGVRGSSREKLLDSIQDFADIGDFIHRPVREYSSGMFARLAFAVATSTRPEILIVDEVLGVGDAYFLGRSIQRMRELTDNGATVLYVSHDLSTVQQLCDRAVWIDGGKVKDDGEVLVVSKRYLQTVREKQEQELSIRMESGPSSKSEGLSVERDLSDAVSHGAIEGINTGNHDSLSKGVAAPLEYFSGAPHQLNPEDRYGSGLIAIAEFSFRDSGDEKRHTLITGDPVSARFDLISEVDSLPVTLVIAIYLPDGQCAMQLASTLDEVRIVSNKGRMAVEVRIDRFCLGPGDYVVSVGVFPELDVRSAQEQPAYDILDRYYPLKVLSAEGISLNVGIANQRARWATHSVSPGTSNQAQP